MGKISLYVLKRTGKNQYFVDILNGQFVFSSNVACATPFINKEVAQQQKDLLAMLRTDEVKLMMVKKYFEDTELTYV